MAMARRKLIAAALAGFAFSSSATAAEQLPNHQKFKDLMFLGCMPAVVTGSSIDTYVQRAQLSEANPQLAAAFLQGRPGTAYLKADQVAPMVLVRPLDGSCTVASRFAPDPTGLVSMAEEMLIGPGSPFKRIEIKEGRALDGAPTQTRKYQGTINSKTIRVLLSTTSSRETLSQAMATVYEVQP